MPARYSLRILLVDDDAADIELTRRAFRDVPAVAMDVVRTGEKALAAVDEGSYDVVLLDYRLPDWEGARLCREMKLRGAKARIIMVTSAASETMVARALDAGAERVVAKTGDYLRRLREDLVPQEAL